MNGRDVADAQIHRVYLAEMHALLEWAIEALNEKRSVEPLTAFETQLLKRAEKVGEM